MVLVDTSVWVDHLRSSDVSLVNLLNQDLVLVHPMVIGELACGNLQNRQQLLKLFGYLPYCTEASNEEAMYCLEQNQLMGKGIGFVDLHLLASALLTPNAKFWTRDKRLKNLADNLGIGWQAHH